MTAYDRAVQHAERSAELDFAEGIHDPDANPYVRRDGLRLVTKRGYEDLASVWADVYAGKYLSL